MQGLVVFFQVGLITIVGMGLSSCTLYQKIYNEPVQVAHIEVFDHLGKPAMDAGVGVSRNRRKVGWFEPTVMGVADGKTNSNGYVKFENLIIHDGIGASSPDLRFFGFAALASGRDKYTIHLKLHPGAKIISEGDIDQDEYDRHSKTIHDILKFHADKNDPELEALNHYIALGIITKKDGEDLLQFVSSHSIEYVWGVGKLRFSSMDEPIGWQVAE